MPRIPKDRFSGQINPAARQGVTLPQTGKGRGDVAMGKTIQKAGDQLFRMGAELFERKRLDDANTDASEHFSRVARDFESFSTEGQANFEDSLRGEGNKSYSYAEEANSWIKEQDEAAKENLSPLAYKQYKRRAEGYFQRKLISAEGYEQTSRANYNLESIGRTAENFSQSLVNKPLEENYLEYRAQMSEQIVGASVDAGHMHLSEAKELNREVAQRMSRSFFAGMEANKNYALGLKLLEEENVVAKDLRAEDVAMFKKRFQRGIKREATTNQSIARHKVQEVRYAAQNGIPIPQKTRDDVARLVEASGFKDFEKKVIGQQLKASFILSDGVKELRDAGFTPGEGDIMEVYESVNKRLQDELEVDENSRVVGQLQKNLQAIVKDIDRQVKRDPVSYVAKHKGVDPNDPEAVRKAFAELGLKTNSLITEHQAQQFGRMLTTSEDPGQAAGGLQMLKERYGSDIHYVLNDMVKFGTITPEMFVAAEAESAAMQTRLMENALQKDKIQQNFKGMDFTKKQLTQAANMELEEIRDALEPAGSGRFGLTSSLREAMTTEMMRLMWQGEESDPEDAAETAYERIVENSYQVRTIGIGDVAMPYSYKGQRVHADLIADRLNDLSPVDLEAQNIFVSEDYIAESKAAGLSEQEARWEYYESILDNIRWVLNDDRDGFNAFIDEGPGQRFWISPGGDSPLNRMKKWEISFEDISNGVSFEPKDLLFKEESLESKLRKSAPKSSESKVNSRQGFIDTVRGRK